MPAQLRLTLNRDSDGTGELVAEVAAEGFSGLGSAWFNFSEIASFGELLSSTYPLPVGDPQELKGGIWSSTELSKLEHKCLSLQFYPVGLRGTVACRVHLATHPRTQEGQREHAVTVELHTDYEQLRTFGSALTALASDNGNEAILQFGAV